MVRRLLEAGAAIDKKDKVRHFKAPKPWRSKAESSVMSVCFSWSPRRSTGPAGGAASPPCSSSWTTEPGSPPEIRLVSDRHTLAPSSGKTRVGHVVLFVSSGPQHAAPRGREDGTLAVRRAPHSLRRRRQRQRQGEDARRHMIKASVRPSSRTAAQLTLTLMVSRSSQSIKVDLCPVS